VIGASQGSGVSDFKGTAGNSRSQMTDDTVLLKMTGVVKTFPGVVAVDKVDFDVRRGEVHALVGENGAGKSTLIKILGGVYEPETGTIVFDGEQVFFSSIRSSILFPISVWLRIFLSAGNRNDSAEDSSTGKS
jgi:ABC-type glutathione transport system ATPase component